MGLFDGLISTITNIENSAGNAVNQAEQQVTNMEKTVQITAGNIENTATQLQTTIYGMPKDAINGIVTAFQGAENTIRTDVSNVGVTAQNDLNQLEQNANKTIFGALGNAEGAIGSFGQALGSGFKTLTQPLQNIFDMGKSFFQSGMTTIQKILQAPQDIVKTVQDTSNLIKYAVIGGVAIIGILVLWMIIKRK